MARRTLKLPSISRVSPGATATLEMPIGPTYHNILFSLAGTALLPAHIEEITVFIDGKEIQRYKSLQRLIDINSYYDRGVDTVNEFMLHFFRADMNDLVYRRASGIGTADVQTFHVELKIAATAPADITMQAHQNSNPEPQPLGVFFKLREYPYSSAVAGIVEIDKLPRGAYYTAVHLFKADVNAVEVVVDNQKQIDATKAVLEREQREATPVKRVPLSASATHIDWLLEGDAQQALQTGLVRDFRIKMDLATAGAVDIVTETLDTLSGV
jgi:hypothetical protein